MRIGLRRGPETLLVVGAAFALVTSSALQAQEWSGHAAIEFRGFFATPAESDQPRATVSLSAQPEFYRAWANGHSVLAVPFVRLDSSDPERTHVDVRELVWRMVRDRWELRAGVGKVFWGVAESQHLVDIVNQTDFVENVDGEDKLGQPMIDLTLTRRWGTLDLFLLPGFRKRTYPGSKGRLRFSLPMATELTQFASSSGARHVDAAVRWSRTIQGWDLGVSHFRGTSREPRFLLGTASGGKPVLIPRYELIDQTGLDLQARTGGWLWKLEAITRGGQGDRLGHGHRFNALNGGFEYTWANLRGSGRDVGLLAEYMFDDRDRLATTPFEDDIFLGTRLEWNDVQTSRLLVGVVIDRKTGTTFVNVEGSRRLGNQWTMSLESRVFAGLRPDDYLFGFRHDHYAQLELSWYF